MKKGKKESKKKQKENEKNIEAWMDQQLND